MENLDEIEIHKFGSLANYWWDPNGPFKTLHEINPLRIQWIEQQLEYYQSVNAQQALSGMNVLDVGCGGGLLSEAMADRGAKVTGIDLSVEALQIAQLHQKKNKNPVNYQKISAEKMAQEAPGQFDIVTCLEMLEHVPDPSSVVQSAAHLVKPGGMVFFSTINRNIKAYLLAIVAAEYVLDFLPKGTHDYSRFIKPSELAQWARQAELDICQLTGLHYNPLNKQFSLGQDTSVNYLFSGKKPQN